MPVLTDDDIAAVAERARSLPPASGVYHDTDFVLALLATVVDYQMHTRAVENALNHFKARRADEVQNVGDLVRVFARFPDDQVGNTGLAVYLWGYRLWTRAAQLRRLVEYFESVQVRDLESLRRWAAASNFKQFEGRVRGLGPTVYRWLVMRQGVDTVKPDVHVRRFVEQAVGRRVTDVEVVAAVERAAPLVGKRAYELDWSIWEWSRAQ